MYKAAIVLNNQSHKEKFLKEFPYLKKALLTENELSTLEHLGNFPTLKEFHHSLLEISKFCVKNKIKGLIVASDYEYSDDEYIWQWYVDVKHFSKMYSFTAIVNRNKNINKLIKYLNNDKYFSDLFETKLESTYPTYSSSKSSNFFKEKEINILKDLKNGRLNVHYQYYDIFVEFQSINSNKINNINVKKQLILTSSIKIKNYKDLNFTVANMLDIVNHDSNN